MSAELKKQTVRVHYQGVPCPKCGMVMLNFHAPAHRVHGECGNDRCPNYGKKFIIPYVELELEEAA